MASFDAVVVGAGPNGLTAAVVLARCGLSVLLVEGNGTLGGGLRSEALTLPGFLHDVCSAVHPLASSSPIFNALNLERHGLEWVEPPIALAHPFDDAPPALLHHDIATTAASLGADREAYIDLVSPLVRNWGKLSTDALAPLHWPAHPRTLAQFGWLGVQSAARLLRNRLKSEAARCLLGGIATHGLQPLERAGTAAPALTLATLAHRVGWPVARGGSQALTHALAAELRRLGGKVETGHIVRSLHELPAAGVTLLDLTPRQVLDVCGDVLSRRYARALRGFQYGPGIFKVDWALSSPVPWRDNECRTAGTLHLAGSFDALRRNELSVARGEHPSEPTVLLAQPSLFDASRVPAASEGAESRGRMHTLWAYCHVPSMSTVDMLPRIEAQIERFAPGFRDCVVARHTMNTHELEQREPNAIGGDIGQGAYTLRQLFFRPVMRANPYATSLRGVYLCSASTPPGAGVHGMCGYYAAKSALREVFGIAVEDVVAIGTSVSR